MTSRIDAPALAQRGNPDQRDLEGPFDIIGDVHGCAGELIELLGALGYEVAFSGSDGTRKAAVTPPAGRRAIFVGDLVDRGPASPDVMRLVMAMVERQQAFCVPGNHDVKFVRWLEGRHVKLSHGLDRTAAQFESEAKEFRDACMMFLARLPIYLWLAGGRLAVAHAGVLEPMLGRDSGEIRSFCLYGDTSGERDEQGLPVRYHWGAGYRGTTSIVYGHTPVPEADWVNNTLCIDTGCCFGNKLTALRWPERKIVSVCAREAYSPTRRPLGHPPVRPGVEI